jgi:hypothetical protein
VPRRIIRVYIQIAIRTMTELLMAIATALIDDNESETRKKRQKSTHSPLRTADKKYPR